MKSRSLIGALGLLALSLQANACLPARFEVTQSSVTIADASIRVSVDQYGCVTVHRSAAFLAPGTWTLQLSSLEMNRIQDSVPAFSQATLDWEAAAVEATVEGDVIDGDRISVWIAPMSRQAALTADIYGLSYRSKKSVTAPQHIAMALWVQPILALAFDARLLQVQ